MPASFSRASGPAIPSEVIAYRSRASAAARVMGVMGPTLTCYARAMRYRPFGRTGLKVSAVGFVCWPMAGDHYGAIEDDQAVKSFHRALDRGVNCVFFFQAEDGIRDLYVTGVKTCALPISGRYRRQRTPVQVGLGAQVESVL